jgi:hypothetical protein
VIARDRDIVAVELLQLPREFLSAVHGRTRARDR